MLDPVKAYEQAGLIAESEPLQFVGNVEYLAGASPDSSLMLLTLSLANHALTFSPEPDAHVAHYQVSIDLKQNADLARHVDARETVKIGSFHESARTDESIVFQQFIRVAPGRYVLSISVRDEGSSRNGQFEQLVNVPRLAPISLSSPIAVYSATPRETLQVLPELIANPRATSIFGRDSLVRIYLEGYGLPGQTPVSLAAFSASDTIVWRDTILLAHNSDEIQSGVIEIPVASLGVGQLTLTATPVNATDTVRSRIFINFADEWSIGSFGQMIDYLRYFATDEHLNELRTATGAERAARWASFYSSTDPDTRTTEHEGLLAYFRRIRVANERFGEDSGLPGWLTERGEAFVTLGEPDQILQNGDNSLSDRGRAQIWTYSQHGLQLVFIDQTGFGRWRMTSNSASDFQIVAARVRK
jgi:GWxTD domain-containing protein